MFTTKYLHTTNKQVTNIYTILRLQCKAVNLLTNVLISRSKKILYVNYDSYSERAYFQI